jgi:hypothetical protein
MKQISGSAQCPFSECPGGCTTLHAAMGWQLITQLIDIALELRMQANPANDYE